MPQSIRDTLREFYDATARDRDAGTIQDWKVAVRAKFIELLRHEGKRSLLELGAGPGRDSRFFRDQGFETVSIDLSPEMVALCIEKGLTAYVMDMAELSFADGSFDAVYAMNSLLHLPKAEFQPVLRQVERVLRPGGLFFLGVYGGTDREGEYEDDFREPHRFFSFFTDEHIQQEAARVFEVVSFEAIEVEVGDVVHFQWLVLRKKNG